MFVDREKSQPPAGAQEGGFRSTADRIAERAQKKWNNPDQNDEAPLVIFAEACTAPHFSLVSACSDDLILRSFARFGMLARI